MTSEAGKEFSAEGLISVERWIGTMRVIEGRVEITEIEQVDIKSALEALGADFEEKEGMEKLKQSTNRYRRPGMNAVWGKDFMDKYNKWTTKWANKFESTGEKLPQLKDGGSRTSGMRHLLGLLTAFAADAIDYQTFKNQMEIRILNGYLYQKGKKRKEANFLSDGKKFPGSIPPGFPQDFWDALKSGEFSTTGSE